MQITTSPKALRITPAQLQALREAELSAWAPRRANVATWLPGLALGHGQAARSAGRASTGLPAHIRKGTS